MERSDDVSRKINDHLNSRWGKVFLCTAQEVRESIVVSLLGMRVGIQALDTRSPDELRDMWKRCFDIHEQIRTLFKKGDTVRGKRFLQKLRTYQKAIGQKLGGQFLAIVPVEQYDIVDVDDATLES